MRRPPRSLRIRGSPAPRSRCRPALQLPAGMARRRQRSHSRGSVPTRCPSRHRPAPLARSTRCSLVRRWVVSPPRSFQLLCRTIIDRTDLVLPGRISAAVQRTYNPFDPFAGIAGFELATGPGWALSVDVVLLTVNTTLRRMILPGDARIAFVQQADGTFVNTV